MQEPGQEGFPSGRPPNIDAQRYKGRNQVERGFGRLKQFRAVATRYDKFKDRYEATVTIASIMVWLRANPTRAHHDPSERPKIVS